MATRLSTAARNASCAATTALIDAGAAEGYFEIRTGGQPATPNTAATGTVLATIPFADPAFAGPVNGTAAALGVPLGANGSADGTAGWFRCYDSNDAPVWDGAIRASADPDNGEEMVLASTAIVIGQPISISSFTYTQPLSE